MVRRVVVGLLGVVMAAGAAAAQPLGTFQFQLLPYCNVVSLAVVQQGGQYQLDGTDNQCGVGPRASVTGLALFFSVTSLIRRPLKESLTFS